MQGYFHGDCLIHDFHNGGQRGKNGNYNIRARPVRLQQNIHGRVSNVTSHYAAENPLNLKMRT